MDKNKIFEIIQGYLIDVPVILVGTGATIPLKIPGMKPLADYLIKTLNRKYKTCTIWRQVAKELKAGVDLENALTGVSLYQDLEDDIKISTWELITKHDLELFRRIRSGKEKLALAQLIDCFYKTHPKCVNIITTNYDRAIEYACDQVRTIVDTRYHGSYIRYFSDAPLGKSKVVNLLKVHGSLDLFKCKDALVYAIPLQSEMPGGFTPEIVTPGVSKYEAVLKGEFRSILHIADSVIDGARGYLCIGYGFNDEQVQARIIAGIKAGKPIVVVTMSLSEKAKSLLLSNSKKIAIIEVANPQSSTGSMFTINGDQYFFEEIYWTIEGLLEIIK